MFMKSFMCVAAAAFSFSLVACGSPGSQQAEQGVAYVQVDPTRQWVSIDATDASVRSILLELSKQAGLSLTISDVGELGRITLAVKNIAIEDGIQRVLGSTPYMLRHAVEENGRKILAAVDVHRGMLDRVDSRQSTSAVVAVATRTADSGWGVNQGNKGDSADDSDREAELAATLEDLSLDTIKQLMREAKDPALRMSMLDTLTERDDQSSVRPLFLDALQDADVDVRGAALEYLKASFDPIPLVSLAHAVDREPNSVLRAYALALLSEQALEDGRTKEDLAVAMASVNRALTDPDPAVREQAQWSLEELSQGGYQVGIK